MTTTPRRLVYVSASTLPSTAANAVHVAQMCDAFAGLGVEVVLRARRGSNASGAATVSEHYGLSHAFRIDDASVLADALWMLRQGLGRIAPRRPATLYYGRKLHTLTRLAGWGCPTGLELHHPPRNERQAASLRRMIESRGFLGLVVISEALRTELLARCPRLAARDVLVAHDGVRAAHRVEPQLRVNEPLRAVYCGSFHPGKGVETLLAAAALVPEVAFDVIGGEPVQIDALRAQAPANVRFLGALPHAHSQRLLPGCDIALAPYGAVVHGVRTPAHENLAAWMSPLKLFEYMGAGLPIVSSDLPVLREVLRDGETALMPPPDDPAALAAAVRTLAADPALRLRLARAAQQTLSTCTWEYRAARVLDFLDTQRERRSV